MVSWRLRSDSACGARGWRFQSTCLTAVASSVCTWQTSPEFAAQPTLKSLRGVAPIQCATGQAIQEWRVVHRWDTTRTTLTWSCCDLSSRVAPPFLTQSNNVEMSSSSAPRYLGCFVDYTNSVRDLSLAMFTIPNTETAPLGSCVRRCLGGTFTAPTPTTFAYAGSDTAWLSATEQMTTGLSVASLAVVVIAEVSMGGAMIGVWHVFFPLQSTCVAV